MMKILVVDDEQFDRELLAFQLMKFELVEVVSFELAQDALAALEADPTGYDLVFCDLQMPEMDGLELMRHLARIHYLGGVVLLSGEDQRILQAAASLAQAHRLDLWGSFNKPVSARHLHQVLDERRGQAARAQKQPVAECHVDELRNAIARGELINYYQPKVEITTGAVAGVESLVRWLHPQRGLVFPDRFIGTAEKHGLIDDLTKAVLTNALRQAGQWQGAGLHLHVAVNVSMDNLDSLEFPSFVDRTAKQFGISPSMLVLEITESRLVKDRRAPLEILARLRLRRIGISIDDFGTGHSSLAQLRDFPFDELKIDAGFVHGAGSDASLRAIFEASRRMGRELGMKVVAEGVEDRADWDFLRTTDCDLAQGYFIARPMPGPGIIDWISAWQARYPSLVS